MISTYTKTTVLVLSYQSPKMMMMNPRPVQEQPVMKAKILKIKKSARKIRKERRLYPSSKPTKTFKTIIRISNLKTLPKGAKLNQTAPPIKKMRKTKTAQNFYSSTWIRKRMDFKDPARNNHDCTIAIKR